MTSRDGMPLPECWGVDTSAKLTEVGASALAAAKYSGNSLRFIWRYVSLGQPKQSDITDEEIAAILPHLALMLVQHVRLPGWTASRDLGALDGEAAAHHALSVGYAPGCSLAMDLEGCKVVGQPVIDHCLAWAGAVRSAGFSPVLYVGYASGLSPVALGALPFDCFWSDYGQRQVAPMGFACKQFAQTTIAGILVDPDHAYPDTRAATLVAMVDPSRIDTLPPTPVDPVIPEAIDPA